MKDLSGKLSFFYASGTKNRCKRLRSNGTDRRTAVPGAVGQLEKRDNFVHFCDHAEIVLDHDLHRADARRHRLLTSVRRVLFVRGERAYLVECEFHDAVRFLEVI